MLKIALTGGIGCGKTRVSDIFQSLGIPIIDTDIISRQLVEPGMPALEKIASEFGASIITKSGELDRAELRKKVFANEQQKQRLESILHPLIRDAVDQKIRTLSSPYCIIVIPLLIETSQQDRFDRILVVDCSESTQKVRVLKRDNISAELFEQILESQVSRSTRLSLADDIVKNDGDLSELKEQILHLDQKYRSIT